MTTEAIFEEEATAKGHYLKRDEDDPNAIDYHAMSVEMHNGPTCENCHESWCIHCWKGDRDHIHPCPKPTIECVAIVTPKELA